MLNIFIGLLSGYILHDAVQPTAVGQTLDKLALPADLFTDVPAGSDDEKLPLQGL